jgi:hypothetical protein
MRQHDAVEPSCWLASVFLAASAEPWKELEPACGRFCRGLQTLGSARFKTHKVKMPTTERKHKRRHQSQPSTRGTPQTAGSATHAGRQASPRARSLLINSASSTRSWTW